ncbi:hypothetical protein FB451DRAFT_1434867 [Mycena latifolia]|nr:hypothetical protein FB451DRAFT_1434867 [Mycena latifolia]
MIPGDSGINPAVCSTTTSSHLQLSLPLQQTHPSLPSRPITAPPASDYCACGVSPPFPAGGRRLRPSSVLILTSPSDTRNAAHTGVGDDPRQGGLSSVSQVVVVPAPVSLPFVASPRPSSRARPPFVGPLRLHATPSPPSACGDMPHPRLPYLPLPPPCLVRANVRAGAAAHIPRAPRVESVSMPVALLLCHAARGRKRGEVGAGCARAMRAESPLAHPLAPLASSATRVEAVPYEHAQLTEAAPPQQVARVRKGRGQCAVTIEEHRRAPAVALREPYPPRIAVEERGRRCGAGRADNTRGVPSTGYLARVSWRGNGGESCASVRRLLVSARALPRTRKEHHFFLAWAGIVEVLGSATRCARLRAAPLVAPRLRFPPHPTATLPYPVHIRTGINIISLPAFLALNSQQGVKLIAVRLER